MKEINSAATGGSNSRPFSPENAQDHIHIVPDFMDETDRALFLEAAQQKAKPSHKTPSEKRSPQHLPAPDIPKEKLLPGPKGKGAPAPIDKPPSPPAEVQGAVPQNPADCAASNAYLELLNKAYDYMYEPDRLGDYDALKSKYNCQIKNVDDAVKYAGEALAITKDPYNSVFDKKQSESRGDESRGVWKGFGFNFASKQDVEKAGAGAFPSPLKVTGVFAGSPVEKQNIKPGDFIVGVNQTSLKGKTFDEAYALVKADGAKVFTIARDGKEFDVPVTPGDIPIPAVTEKRLDDNIAYINLKTFGQATTAEQLKKAVEKNVNADGFIIDLRHNPGGFFDEAIKAASLFVKDGTVVTVRERIPPAQIAATGNVTITPPMNFSPVDAISVPGASSDSPSLAEPAKPIPPVEPRFNYQHTSYDLTATGLNKVMTNEGTQETNTEVKSRFPDLVDKPTVILVDADSASSSEVFTGALKDHGDAYVVGTRTYGKGIGQMNFYGMPGGSTLRVTNFHYFNPSGHWPGDAAGNRIGIMPDQLVPTQPGVARGSDQDLQLQAGIAQINKMLGRAPKVVAPAGPGIEVAPTEKSP